MENGGLIEFIICHAIYPTQDGSERPSIYRPILERHRTGACRFTGPHPSSLVTGGSVGCAIASRVVVIALFSTLVRIPCSAAQQRRSGDQA